jgi:uncharacterized membrane protein
MSVHQNLQTSPIANRWFHPLLLLVWIAIGTILRFTNLTGKSPWTDEWATLVFSSGNSFLTVPLDRAISPDILLQPLQVAPGLGIKSVIDNLMRESTHPPVYFVLAHLWMKLFPTDGGMVSLWAARSLPVILGVASIPAIFALSNLAFGSRLVGQMAAAAMAVSPFGIFIAQEARHYTLPVLLIVCSLCCLVIAARAVKSQNHLPVWVGLIWVLANNLGIAVHYFFILAIAAEALVLLPFWLQEVIASYRFKSLKISQPWWQIYAVAAGNLVGCLVWVPIWLSIQEHSLTEWIYSGNLWDNLLAPVARIIAWTITMLFLLPIESQPLPIMLISGSVTVVFTLGIVLLFIQTLKIQKQPPVKHFSTLILGGFVVAAIALFLVITYIKGTDLTLAARYQFVYFPAIIVLTGLMLASCWEYPGNFQFNFLKINGKTAAVTILLMGLVGGIVVAVNLGYQKADRPELVVAAMINNRKQKSPEVPVLIATVHKTHEQTGEIMGLAWEFKHFYKSLNPDAASQKNSLLFLLAHKSRNAAKNPTDTLNKTLKELPKPLDLWLVNFSAEFEAESQNCLADPQGRQKVSGYRYRLYHCS